MDHSGLIRSRDYKTQRTFQAKRQGPGSELVDVIHVQCITLTA